MLGFFASLKNARSYSFLANQQQNFKFSFSLINLPIPLCGLRYIENAKLFKIKIGTKKCDTRVTNCMRFLLVYSCTLLEYIGIYGIQEVPITSNFYKRPVPTVFFSGRVSWRPAGTSCSLAPCSWTSKSTYPLDGSLFNPYNTLHFTGWYRVGSKTWLRSERSKERLL